MKLRNYPKQITMKHTTLTRYPGSNYSLRTYLDTQEVGIFSQQDTLTLPATWKEFNSICSRHWGTGALYHE